MWWNIADLGNEGKSKVWVRHHRTSWNKRKIIIIWSNLNNIRTYPYHTMYLAPPVADIDQDQDQLLMSKSTGLRRETAYGVT